MLVLTRKNRQSIMIGDDIEIVVVSNDGTKVRLGIRAPQTTAVHRTEIYEQIQAESQEGDGERRDLSRVHGGRAG